MASLADELLADLGSDASGDEQDYELHQAQPSDAPQLPTEQLNGKKRAHPSADDEQGTESGAGQSETKRFHLDDADLEDLDDLEEGDGDDNDGETTRDAGAYRDTDEFAASGSTSTMQLGRNAVKPAEELDKADVEDMDMTKLNDVHQVANLMTSGKIDGVIKQIDHYMSLPEPDIAGVLEESPEYHLIVKANNLAVDVDNEVMVVHKFIRDHYSPRFPELESLIINPWEFVQAVQALGNDEDLSRAKLEGVLPHGTVVVISMTASTTEGRPLEAKTWQRVQEACELVFELEAVRRKILAYVESRMTFIAPNLSAVVGTRTATKLLGAAGGLEGLSKIPACNLHLLGANRKTGALGLSSVAQSGGAARSNGFIAQSELVQSTPDDYKRQAVRMVCAKALLAARMDAGKSSSRDGGYGQQLHAELARKLDKLQEPPPQKLEKVLPVPKEGGHKKRRGGRRARAAKERYGMTELRKMANRVEFGKPEQEAFGFDESVGLGMIGSGSTGKVRAQVGEDRSKARMSKANKNRIAALRQKTTTAAAALESSGMASSLSFTPVQGLELIDPSRQQKAQQANEKWFKEGQFSLLPGAGTKSSTLLQFPGSMPPPPPPASRK
ncbi:U4/U6-U5 snRNP complex subunit prp31 [Thecaphora frezii]